MGWERAPRRIDDVIGETLPPARSALVELGRSWARLVGPDLARVSFPARLARDGTLHVHCADATWASELQLLEADVRARLEAGLGEAAPARLRFRVGPLPLPAPLPTRPSLAVPDDLRASAEERARAISDPALREAVARALAASLARRRADDRTGGSGGAIR